LRASRCRVGGGLGPRDRVLGDGQQGPRRASCCRYGPDGIMKLNLLLLDNYDSFTWNLAQYFGELGATVSVERNDAISIDAITARKPDAIAISPGPCTPNEAGISMEVVRSFAGQIPI